MKNSSIAILRAAVAAAVVTFSAGAANAATLVSVDDLSDVFSTKNFNLAYGVSAGIRSVSLDGGTSAFAFCIDPTTPLVGKNDYSVGAATVTTGLMKLYESSYASTIATYQATGDVTGVAAFQLAVWELQNDDGKLNDGKLQFTGSELNQLEVQGAQTLLTAASNYQLGKSIYTYTALTSAKDGFQSQTLLTVSAVPEPETYAMMLAGLGFVGFMARRRKAA